MTILIVDDGRTNLLLLREQLESGGYAVLEALNGLEALEVLGEKSVDVIISDILMPTMDGYKLCYEVQKDHRLRNIPFIFYTATYTSPGDEKFALELGGGKAL